MKLNIKNRLFLLGGYVALLVLVVFAASWQRSPAQCNGQWSSCSNAFNNDANRASFTATNTANGSSVWRNYSFYPSLVKDSAVVNFVTVRADFFATTKNGSIKVRVSGDGGVNYGPSHVIGGNTAEQTFNINVTSDLAWMPSMLSNNNLMVNATCFKNVSTGPNPTCRLDWIPVTVEYTPFDFNIVQNQTNQTVLRGESIATLLTVNHLGGISQQVNLSYINCPNSSTCSFGVTSGIPTYNSVFTVQTTPSTPTGLYDVLIIGTGDGFSRYASVGLNVTS